MNYVEKMELPKIGKKYKWKTNHEIGKRIIFECIDVNKKVVTMVFYRGPFREEGTISLEKFWDEFKKRRFTKSVFE